MRIVGALALIVMATPARAAPEPPPVGWFHRYNAHYVITHAPADGDPVKSERRVDYQYLTLAADVRFASFDFLGADLEWKLEGTAGAYARVTPESPAGPEEWGLLPTAMLPRVVRPLKLGEAWEQGYFFRVRERAAIHLEQRVIGEEKMEGRDCWLIQAKPKLRLPIQGLGYAATEHLQTCWVEKSSGDVVRLVAESIFEGTRNDGVPYSTHERSELTLFRSRLLPEPALQPRRDEARALLALDEVYMELRRAIDPQVASVDELLQKVNGHIERYTRSGEYLAPAANLRYRAERLRGEIALYVAAREAVLDQPAPDISLWDLADKPIRLADLRGKIVLLALGGLRYPEGHDASVYLDRDFAQKFDREKVAVLFAEVYPSETIREDIALHQATHRTSYPLLIGDGEEAALAFRLFREITTVLIDREGVVRYYGAGWTPKTLRETLQQLLAE